MGLGLRNLTIGLTMLLAVVAVLPAAAQEATPATGASAQNTIEMPETRIVALSPDGTLLVAGNTADGRPRQLCVYEVATLTELACGDLDGRKISIWLDSVVWSPDSTKIAFTEDAFRTLRDGDLWMMDAATGEITNLTDDGSEGRLPILGDDEEPSDVPIHVDVLPAWAPDSRAIAFSRSPIIGGEFRGNQVVSVDLDSGEVETLVPVTLDVPGVVYFGLAWAPDGERLYYSVAFPDPDEASNGVWVHDRATGRTEHILSSDPEKGPPALIRVAATGQTGLIIYPIYFGQYSAEGDYYALIELETNALTPLHPVASDSSSHIVVRVATFSPDGTRVLYGLHRLEDNQSRFLVRPLPDGQPEAAVAEIEGTAMMTTIGGGLFWANDGTV
ncbi:MAG: TolB family protein, partial [Thermomicrobiales bacterium]